MDSNQSSSLNCDDSSSAGSSGEIEPEPSPPSAVLSHSQSSQPPPSLTSSLFDESARDTIITGPITSMQDESLESGGLMDDDEDETSNLSGPPGPVAVGVNNNNEDETGSIGEIEDCSEEEGELSEEEEEEVKSDLEEVNPDLEEGEVGAGKPGRGGPIISISAPDNQDLDLEEGEVEDEEDSSRTRNKPATSVCRFFGKGTCTWGTNCRFLHPGVIDKGLYNMFDPMRPPLLPPPPSATMKPGLLGHGPKKPDDMAQLPAPPILQTPWERAQRAAKELIKKSERRKETDIDFEDKKMNLTLTEVEFDKENDYYVSKENKVSGGSPVGNDLDDIGDEDVAEALASTREARYRSSNSGGVPALLPSPPPQLRNDKIDPDFVRERVHHIRVRQAPPRDITIGREAPPREVSPRMVRESALMRRGPPVPRYHNVDLSPVRRDRDSRKSFDDWNERDSWRPDRGAPPRGRPPIKRGRSPSDARSPSSYSSSRSSSTGSSSSRSSSGSGRRAPKVIRESKVRKAPPRPDSPPPKIHRIAPPIETEMDYGRDRDRGNYGPPRGGGGGGYRGGRGGGGGRMGPGMDRSGGPPPPNRPRGRNDNRPTNKSRDSSRSTTSRSSISRSRSRSHSQSRSRSPSRSRRTRSKFSRDRSVSSRSRSRSRSPVDRAGRNRNSSKEPKRSYSSDSDGGGSNHSYNNKNRLKRKRSSPSPEVKIIKPEPSEKVPLASQLQNKKNSTVKMTLKPNPGGLKVNKSVLDRLADDVLDDDDDEDDDVVIGSTDQGSNEGSNPGDKTSASRRAELLKQLKAVEDAIAKKRLKVVPTGDGK